MSDRIAFTSNFDDDASREVDEVPLDDELGNPPEDDSPIVDSDHPILTSKETWGWYMYDFANSVYARYVHILFQVTLQAVYSLLVNLGWSCKFIFFNKKTCPNSLWL
jgi:hypothetical protein